MSSKPSFPPGTRVCLYLRRSDEKQEESIETQRDAGTRWCNERRLVIACEYIDDAVSRAEFVRRKGLTAMLVDAEASAPGKRRKKPRDWSVVVCSESSRLGGDMQRTPLILQTLLDAGCSVVYHRSDELVQLNTSTDRLMATMRAYTDELEREKTSERTAEKLAKLVRDGLAAGAPCFGYRIVNKRYVIDEAQATSVRRIFDLYIDGVGCRAIARRLNGERVPAPPNAGKRSLGVWCRPTVRRILLNERYRGVAKHGREQKVYRGGTRIRVVRPSEQVVEYQTPAIVTAEQWATVAAKMASNPRFAECTTSRGAPSRHFLVGRTRCASCGGAVFGRKSGKRPPVYVCGRRSNGGVSVCDNAMAHNISTTDAQLVAEIVRAITPAIRAATLRDLHEALAAELRANTPDERACIEGDIKTVKRKIKRLIALAVATESDEGDSEDAVAEAVREHKAQLKALEARLAASGATSAALDQIAVYEARAREQHRMPELTPELALELFAIATAGEPMQMSQAGISGSFDVATLLSAGEKPSVLNAPDCDTPRSGHITERTAHAALMRVPFRVRLRAA